MFIEGIFSWMHDKEIMNILCQRCFQSDANIPLPLMAKLAIHALEIMYHYVPGPGLSTLYEDNPWYYLHRKSKIQAEQLIQHLPRIISMWIDQYRNERVFGARVAEYGIRVLGGFASSTPQDRMIIAAAPLIGENSIVDFLASLSECTSSFSLFFFGPLF
jgi:hypothetical protein